MEGWVEFEDKKAAKRVAELLNAQRIGTKKGDFWYDDLWSMKYLPKFKWHHLTEQIGIFLISISYLMYLAYQNASRAEKLRNEIAQEKRANSAFERNLERNNMIHSIQRKRQDRGYEKEDKVAVRRQFNQNAVILGDDEQGSVREERYTDQII